MRSQLPSIVAALLSALASHSAAQVSGTAAEPDPGWTFEFAPAGRDYEDYVADPRRPVFALTNVNAYDSSLPASGNSLNQVRLGARFGVLRFGPPGPRAMQLDAHVGFLAEFDRDNSTDNLGWDGFYGFDLTWRPSPRLGFQLGFAHDSSHLGDEYAEATGRARAGYTREELNLGARVTLARGLDTYAEYARASTLRDEDDMERGRAQGGLEWEGPTTLARGRFAPYLALDVGAYEEDDWDPNFNAQAGFVRRPENGSVWRFGLEFYDGRHPIGELFREDRQHVAFGVWVEP